MREETEGTYRDGLKAMYEEEAQLLGRLAKVAHEIAEIEWEMRQHGLKVNKVVVRTMVEMRPVVHPPVEAR